MPPAVDCSIERQFGYEADQFTTPPDLSGLRLAESVFVTKENGEACHLAFFPAAGGKWHACVGSKNVHVVISVLQPAGHPLPPPSPAHHAPAASCRHQSGVLRPNTDDVRRPQVHSVEEARKDIAHYLALSRPLAPGGQVCMLRP